MFAKHTHNLGNIDNLRLTSWIKHAPGKLRKDVPHDEVSIDLPHGLPHEFGLSLLLGRIPRYPKISQDIPRRNPGAPKPRRGWFWGMGSRLGGWDQTVTIWLWLTYSLPWKITTHAIKNGKPSISIRAIEKPWRTVSHNQGVHQTEKKLPI